MRLILGSALLAVLLEIQFCAAQSVSPAPVPTAPTWTIPSGLTLVANDISLAMPKITPGPPLLILGLGTHAPRPARSGGLIPIDVRATTSLLPTDIRHQVNFCTDPAPQKH